MTKSERGRQTDEQRRGQRMEQLLKAHSSWQCSWHQSERPKRQKEDGPDLWHTDSLSSLTGFTSSEQAVAMGDLSVFWGEGWYDSHVVLQFAFEQPVHFHNLFMSFAYILFFWWLSVWIQCKPYLNTSFSSQPCPRVQQLLVIFLVSLSGYIWHKMSVSLQRLSISTFSCSTLWALCTCVVSTSHCH